MFAQCYRKKKKKKTPNLCHNWGGDFCFFVFNPSRREGLKTTIESVIMIIPLFLKTVIALRFFFRNVFWSMGWFRYMYCTCIETHFGYAWYEPLVMEGLKKNLNLWSWSYVAGTGWKRQILYGHLYWKLHEIGSYKLI